MAFNRNCYLEVKLRATGLFAHAHWQVSYRAKILINVARAFFFFFQGPNGHEMKTTVKIKTVIWSI